MKPLTLEQQLERSVRHVQMTKAAAAVGSIDDWLAVTPVPPKRLERNEMTSTAIQRTEPEQQLARVAPVDSLAEWRAMREQASELVKSGFLPKAVNTPEKAMAIIQTGKELGLGPMQSLRSIHIIDGKPTMGADLIGGLALSKVPGSVLRVAESTNSKCVIKAARAGQELTTFTFTMEDAQKAGLTGKQNWRNYPRAMLRARAITEAARAIFPDAVMGLYDPDELGAITSPSGEVIQVTDITPVAQPQRADLSPHREIGMEPDGPQDDDLAAHMINVLEALKADCATCDSYDKALALREAIGSRAKQSKLTKGIQEAHERGDINADTKAALGKLWAHCDRQVTKLEKQLAPGPEEIAHSAPEDDTEAFGAGGDREPGEEG